MFHILTMNMYYILIRKKGEVFKKRSGGTDSPDILCPYSNEFPTLPTHPTSQEESLSH